MDNQEGAIRALTQAVQEMTKCVVVLATDVDYIKKDMAEVKKRLQDTYVTQDQFQPIRNLVYGAAATLGFGVLGAIAKLIFIK